MIKSFLRICFLVLVYSYLYIPIIILITNSFNKSRFGNIWERFTITWYNMLWHDDSIMQAAGNSLIIAFISSTCATMVGTLSAVSLFSFHFKGKTFISGMLFVVMMSPDIVMAISMLLVFMLLGISLGFWSLLFAHITFCLPFAVVSVYSRLNDFDIRMLEAARDLGATDLIILRKIIIPLILPAIVSSWLLSFTISMDDVVISSFVTGPVYEILPIKIYSMVKVGILPEINALATILLLFSIILGLVSNYILKIKSFNFFNIFQK